MTRAAPRSRRRTLLLRFAPAAVVLTLLALALLSLTVFAGRGNDAYSGHRYQDALVEYDRLHVGSVVQRWVAPFDRGDALYRRSQFAAAQREFALALPLAPSDERCTVRNNLVLAGHRIGDAAVAAKDRAGAIRAYTRALRDATTGGCARLADQRAELQELLDALNSRSSASSSPTPTGSPSGTATQTETQQQRLDRRNQKARVDQRNGNDIYETPTPSARPADGNW